MSQENVEVVRQLYQAKDARNLESVAELANPDVEWMRPDSLLGRRRRGRSPLALAGAGWSGGACRAGPRSRRAAGVAASST
jgi:hypothetical protein